MNDKLNHFKRNLVKRAFTPTPNTPEFKRNTNIIIGAGRVMGQAIIDELTALHGYNTEMAAQIERNIKERHRELELAAEYLDIIPEKDMQSGDYRPLLSRWLNIMKEAMLTELMNAQAFTEQQARQTAKNILDRYVEIAKQLANEKKES